MLALSDLELDLASFPTQSFSVPHLPTAPGTYDFCLCMSYNTWHSPFGLSNGPFWLDTAHGTLVRFFF